MNLLEGLRERRYFDTALFYLDQLESKQGLPAEIRTVIPFERAITHLGHSRVLRNPDAQREELDRALEYLKKFVDSNPDHALTARANTERARILLGQARVDVALADAATNDDARRARRERARELIAEARNVFQQAHDLHEQAWETFPTFIDPQDTGRFEARRETESNYIRAQLDLALCTYEQAQTYVRGSVEFRQTLSRAAEEFAKIHERYRTQVVGLHARMWQGKCLEEQQEIGKALGIYGELIGHRGRSPALTRLQDQVQQFRLICLNHPDRKDHELAVREASDWLVEHKDQHRTPIGLGIRWERARGLEQLAAQQDSADDERDRYLRQALEDAREIRRYPGTYQNEATTMIQRINVAMNRDPGDPQTFETAFGIAQQNINEIVTLKEQIAETDDPDETSKLEGDLELRLKEAAPLLRLALQLADDRTEQYDLFRARYRLAFVHYELGNSYDAAILGEFVGRRFAEQDPRLALDAAYLALAAYQQATYAAPADQRDAEMRLLIRAARFLADRWPESDKADDARMTLGQMYDDMDQPLEASKWYLEIPESSPRYAEARLAAGRLLWDAYLAAARLPRDQQPPVEELRGWGRSAREHLQTGIKMLQQQLPDESESTQQLILAKVWLAQILVKDGQYEEAIRLLSDPPQAPVQAIAVDDEAARPAEGVQGRGMATLVHRLLLRAYVGTQQIDEALSAMNSLERVADDSDGTGLAAVYVELGQEIQREIERLVGLNDMSRLFEVRTSFDRFLQELTQRRERMPYGSLIWIAETYFGLAEGMLAERESSAVYYTQAAETYEYILKRDRSERDFIDDEREAGVKLRLVHCLRRQGRFAEAIRLAGDILQEKPNALDAQLEAAWTLQDWGAGGGADAAERLMQAVNGMSLADDDHAVWGWSQIALRLQRMPDAGQRDSGYQEKFLQARYNTAWCRHQYGLLQQEASEGDQSLEAAKQEIAALAVVTTDIPETWWKKFDALYQDIQRNLGESPVPLEAPVTVAAATPNQHPQETRSAKEPSRRTAAEAQNGERNPPSGGGGGNWFVLALLLAGGLTALFVFSMRASGRRRKTRYASSDGPSRLTLATASSQSGQRQSSKNSSRSPERPSSTRSQQQRRSSRGSQS